MITRVQIKNYRSIAEVDVELGPLTVLVGRNGTGKSAFLDAIKFLRDAVRYGLENAVIDRGGFDSVRRVGTSGASFLRVEFGWNDNVGDGDLIEGRSHYELMLQGDSHFSIQREAAWCKGTIIFYVKGEKKREVVEDLFIRNTDQWIEEPGLLKRAGFLEDAEMLSSTNLSLATTGYWLGPMVADNIKDNSFYSFFPNDLRPPQKPLPERVLRDKGENFVSVLQQIARNEETKQAVLNALSRVVPGVDDLRVSHAGGYIFAELHHGDVEGEGAWFNLEQESDGTVRMLGLLAALYQEPDEGMPLLALEEPEIALHPGALAVLSDEIKAASARRQILVTTQSPDLISSFDADDLRVVERRDGQTVISRLDETQLEVLNRELFGAGDLLRIQGLRGRNGAE